MPGAVILLLLILVGVILYLVIYPEPIIVLAKNRYIKKYTKGTSVLDENAVVLHTFNFTGYKNHSFTGNLYSYYKPGTKTLPTNNIIIIWIHGGDFVVSNVIGVPKTLEPILKKDYKVMQFDYPTRLKFTQDDTYNYIIQVIKWILDNETDDNTTVFLAGDNVGAFYGLTILDSSLSNKNYASIWTDDDAKAKTSKKFFAISPFVGAGNAITNFLWKQYIQYKSTPVYQSVLKLDSPSLIPYIYVGSESSDYPETQRFATLNNQTKLTSYMTSSDLLISNDENSKLVIQDILNIIDDDDNV